MRAWLTLAMMLPWTAAATASPTLDEIAAAHGGDAALESIESYAARITLTDIWVRQSPTPGPPWRTSSGVRCHALDLEGGRMAAFERRVAAGHYPFHSARWADSKGDRRFNLYDGWRTRAGAADTPRAIHEALRFAPTPLLAAMRREPERVTALGTANKPDAARALFRFEPRDGESLELGFDARTRMLRTLRAGDQTVHYDGYETVEGFPVSRRMAVEWRGETVWRLHLAGAAFNADFPDPPEALSALPEAAGSADEDPRRFRVRTLAPGVHFIGGGATYQLFVEFSDFLVALGGVGGVAERLRALRAVAGDKPLRYALITHHHADHLEGVPALVEAGAVLVVSPAHEPVVREAAGPGRKPAFAHVTERSEITDGERRLVFLELGPMQHSRHMIAAWLPAEKLLFSADLFVQPPRRPVRSANPPIRDLERAVERLGLDVTRFVDTHSPVVANLADLKLAAATEGNWSGFDAVKQGICPP